MNGFSLLLRNSRIVTLPLPGPGTQRHGMSDSDIARMLGSPAPRSTDKMTPRG